ncbi:curli assembly protein CsgF [Aequorivita marina]|uniref:curli assembly protein CsgF n=1 Tax=Aequorivita marina TaxID=3073654 RepID=UPI002876131C|nr:curli assembly protein CsgF [Aequorivita sp. S2608]MDS1299313.1 curli assembly protein CsgF [Aequorivita sp. S2608]
MKSFVLFLFLSVSTYAVGQQLVYAPINPAFVGGNSFNYAWLLNSANAQNSFEDDSQFDAFDRLGGFDRFGKSPFGKDEVPPKGTSIEGDFQYEVFDSSDGLVINVLNIVTGEATQIIIPN